MIKTTVGYAARELGISRQLVHIYIKKGLIRAERSGPARTAPYWLEDEDVKQLLGSMKLVFAHEQRARLLGKKKKRKAQPEAAGTADETATGTAEVVAGTAEGTAEAVEVPLGSSEAATSQPDAPAGTAEAATGAAEEPLGAATEGTATVSDPVAALAASYGVRL